MGITKDATMKYRPRQLLRSGVLLNVAGLLMFAPLSVGISAAQAGQPVAGVRVPSAVGTISEQRAVLRAAYYASLQEISDAQASARTLPRGQATAASTALVGTAVTMRAAAAAISAATTQAEVDAAAQLVQTESLRSSTAKQGAAKLVRLQEMRVDHVAFAAKNLKDRLDGAITPAAYTGTETRASAFSTLLTVAVDAQLQTLGKAVASPALSTEQPLAALKSGVGTIAAAAGWVGFPGGCALPAAEDSYRPVPLSPGPSIVTNAKQVKDAKARMLGTSTLAQEHGYLLRVATAEGARDHDMTAPSTWYPNFVMRLGYGWLAGQDTLSRDKLTADTRQIMLAGPEAMESLRAATVLTSAATAADWVGGIPEVNDSALVRWVAPLTCKLADHDNWVEGPTNLSPLHDSAVLLAAVAFLQDRPAQSAAAAKAALTAVQSSLTAITTDGGTFEGPGYWNYQSPAVSSLYSTVANVYPTPPVPFPSLARVSKYAMNAVTPDGLALLFADSSPQRMSALMPAWDSFARQDPAVAGWVASEYLKARDVRLLWWWASPAPATGPASSLFATTGLGVLQGPGMTAALKGGANGTLHSHLDLGSLSYTSKGVDWIVDPGPGSYSLEGYFSSVLRWTHWKAGTSSHSTISDMGQNQPLTATAPLAVPTPVNAAVDIRTALPGTTRALRTAVMSPTGLSVKDSILSPTPRDLNWQIVTGATVTVSGSTATLTKSGQTLSISFTGMPPGAALTAVAAPETSSTGEPLTLLKLSLPQVTSLTLTAIIS